MKIKVLDRLFIRGFLGPCLLAFFVVEFVLIMQNLWKVIDDILGKGYGFFDYTELLFYFALAIIPMALPLTILLSSVMVYGDMAEKYELSSAKSSGISFTRMLYPGILISLFVFSFSLIASNYLKPKANEGFHKKIRNMKTNKLTFVFDEKIFNQDFKNYSIRIGKKYEDGKSIDDVLIYDNSDADNSILNMIRAKSGKMYTTRDMKYLIMDLEGGYQVKEIRSESADRTRNKYNDYARPVMRFSFSKLRKTFDLAEMLDLNVVNISYKKHEMMSTNELIESIDSLNKDILEIKENNVYNFLLLDDENTPKPPSNNNTKYQKRNNARLSSIAKLQQDKSKTLNASMDKYVNSNISEMKKTIRPPLITIDTLKENPKSLIDIVKTTKPTEIVESIKKKIVIYRSNVHSANQELRILTVNNNKYIFEFHQMYSFATICIIFLFIGAPAGAIVRKGGFGYPVLVAIGFYLTFIMSSILGKKLMGSQSLSPQVSAWLPCFILLPFAIYLSWRALHDNKPILRPFIYRLRKALTKKGPFRMDS